LLYSLFENQVFFLKVDLQFLDTSSSFGKFVKTIVDVLFFNIDTFVLLNVDILIHGDERKIGLWSNVNVTTHLLEVNSADFIDHLMNFTHMDNKLVFDSLGVVKFESLQEFIRHRDKSFLWPWQEPVNVALREQ